MSWPCGSVTFILQAQKYGIRYHSVPRRGVSPHLTYSRTNQLYHEYSAHRKETFVVYRSLPNSIFLYAKSSCQYICVVVAFKLHNIELLICFQLCEIGKPVRAVMSSSLLTPFARTNTITRCERRATQVTLRRIYCMIYCKYLSQFLFMFYIRLSTIISLLYFQSFKLSVVVVVLVVAARAARGDYRRLTYYSVHSIIF